jgi:sigma-B regulation protein RsbU (phosphoserine phosphatase)
MDRDSPLRRELLNEILVPFAGLRSTITVTIEDADGRHIAGTGAVSSSTPSTPELDGEPGATHEIRGEGVIIGRVTARGRDAATPAVDAAIQALAAALAALVSEAKARREAETALTSVGAEAAAERHRRIDDELALGRRLQRSFVALVAPDVPGYDMASHYEQAHEVGGDFFDLFRLLRRGRPLSIVVADVTGKGVAAALLMAFARPLIHAAVDNSTGPADALERTNRVLRERRASLFITALCATLTLSTGRFRLANAGHEPPLLIRRDGSPIEPIEGSGPLLGAFRSLDLPEIVTDLAPGDMVLLYTDGVTDARSATGGRFEDGRLLEAIEAARGGPALDVVESIRSAVDRFQAGMVPADDVTVVAIGRRVPVRGRRPTVRCSAD